MNLQSHANGSSATRFAPAGVAIPAHHVSSRGRPGALVSHERLNMIRSPSVGGGTGSGQAMLASGWSFAMRVGRCFVRRIAGTSHAAKCTDWRYA
jgi:hypothetical protein